MWWRHGRCRPFLTALKKKISCSENAVSVPAPMVRHNTADYQPGSCTLLLFVHVNADVFWSPFLVASLPDGSSVESPHKSKFKWAHSQLIDSLEIGVLSDLLKKKVKRSHMLGKRVRRSQHLPKCSLFRNLLILHHKSFSVPGSNSGFISHSCPRKKKRRTKRGFVSHFITVHLVFQQEQKTIPC